MFMPMADVESMVAIAPMAQVETEGMAGIVLLVAEAMEVMGATASAAEGVTVAMEATVLLEVAREALVAKDLEVVEMMEIMETGDNGKT